MDYTKVYAILKREKFIIFTSGQKWGQWIGDGCSLYNVDGLPPLTADSICPLIGVDRIDSAAYKINSHINEELLRLIYRESIDGDGAMEETDITIRGLKIMGGIGTNAPACLAINGAYLKPFSGDDDIAYLARKKADGRYIIIVKRGLITLGAIMPSHICQIEQQSTQYITNLGNIITMIKEDSDTSYGEQLKMPLDD